MRKGRFLCSTIVLCGLLSLFTGAEPSPARVMAVADSRAGYALYFVSYFLSFAVLVLFLRFGVAAKFRDMAERVTGRRWLQGFVFVPLLILASDIFDLPVRLYWHALSLRYEQSVQRWGSWFWDWTKEELVGTL